MDADSEILGVGRVEKDSDSPASGNDGRGEDMWEMWGEITGADDGPDEANIK